MSCHTLYIVSLIRSISHSNFHLLMHSFIHHSAVFSLMYLLLFIAFLPYFQVHGIDHLVIPTRDYLFAPSLVDIYRAVDFIHSKDSVLSISLWIVRIMEPAVSENKTINGREPCFRMLIFNSTQRNFTAILLKSLWHNNCLVTHGELRYMESKLVIVAVLHGALHLYLRDMLDMYPQPTHSSNTISA